jgi:hypothetical protein
MYIRALKNFPVAVVMRKLAICSLLVSILALGACGGASGQDKAPHWTAWTGCGLISFGPCPANAPLVGVAMVSASEGWAVGFPGTILHYTDGEWSQAPSPNSDLLLGVAMISASEGWAVGNNMFGGAILHYTRG